MTRHKIINHSPAKKGEKMTVKEVNMNKVKEDLKVVEQAVSAKVPSGYIRMELSTKGLLGAPKIFHIRGFDTKEVVELAITSSTELPLKLAHTLDSIILEDDVSINDFHEKEVIELIVKIFAIFYDNIVELDFPWNDEDIKFLLSQGNEQSALDLKANTWKPKVRVNLGSLDFYDVDSDKIKGAVELTSKKDGFKVKFTYPKFGDALVVKRYLDSNFKSPNAEIRGILKKLEVRREQIEAAEKRGQEVDFNSLPYVSREEVAKYTEFETDKAIFAVDLIRALHLVGFESEDLRGLPISEKLSYISDPRITHVITKKIEKEFEKMHFGIKPEIEVVNPFTNKVCTRGFLFRIVDILQAIAEHDSDEYDVGYE